MTSNFKDRGSLQYQIGQITTSQLDHNIFSYFWSVYLLRSATKCIKKLRKVDNCYSFFEAFFFQDWLRSVETSYKFNAEFKCMLDALQILIWHGIWLIEQIL